MARSHAGGGGLTKFKSRLPQIMAELPERSQETAMQIAEQTADGAQQRASSQYEGSDPFSIYARALEAGWVTGWTARTSGTGAAIIGGGAGVFADWYWFFNEFGTTHQPARPFMVPSFEEALDAVYEIGQENFKDL